MAIYASAFVASSRVALWRMGLAERDKSGRYSGSPFKVTMSQKKILRAYRWAEARILFSLGDDSVRKIFDDAIRNGDFGFFSKIARVLAQQPRVCSLPSEQNQLEVFLFYHWAEPRDGLPELFYLTPDALRIVCIDRLKLNPERFTRDALRTTVYRLGLKGFRRQKRDAVFIGGKWTFPPSYKK